MEIWELYYGKGGKNKFSLFLEKNEKRVLSFLGDQYSEELSAFHLSTHSPLLHRKLFEELGLLRGLSVTERGERILSAYPLFGTGDEERPHYPIHFFPFLFSLLSKEMIPRRYERYISSHAFSSLFPWRDEDETNREALDAIETLITKGIIRYKGNRLVAEKDAALRFMGKDETYRLGIIFSRSDGESQKCKDAMTLAFLINGVKEEDIETKLDYIASITGVRLPLSRLLTYGILRKKDGLYTASDIREKKDRAFVTNDMVISSPSYRNSSLWLYSVPIKADSLNQWQMTRISVKTALDWGLNVKDIFSSIETLSGSEVPYLFKERVQSWEEEYGRVEVERGVLIKTEERLSTLFVALPALQEYIIAHPSQSYFFMDGERESEWREILSQAGLEMLPQSKGPEFQGEDEESFLPLLSPSPSLPLEREVPFLENDYLKTLSNSKTLIQKSLVSSKTVFSSKTEVKLEWVDGLDYEEKKALTLRAISDSSSLALEWTDGREDIVRPLALRQGEDAILVTEEGEIPFNPIWRVALLPGYIRRMDPDSLDSGNL